jgi:hypothetical protein
MNAGKMVSELRRMTVAELRRKHAEGAVSDQAEKPGSGTSRGRG